MRLAVVTQYQHGVGELSAKGRVVRFTRDVCSAEPRQGSRVRYTAIEQRKGPPVADKVLVLDGNSGGAEGREGEVDRHASTLTETIE
jgi:hypothetical protein